MADYIMQINAISRVRHLISDVKGLELEKSGTKHEVLDICYTTQKMVGH